MNENTPAVNTVSPVKAALNYGVIFGALLIIEFVTMYLLDINPQEQGTIAVVNALVNYIVLPFTFIILACNTYKKLNGGFISYGQALKIGVIVTVIASIVLGIFNIIFNLILPEIQVEMIQKAKENMVKQNPNMTSEQLEAGLQVAEVFMKPYVLLPLSILMYAFIGLINSLIIGAIVKKENPGGF
ncbi:DUF4199 domain-containing protein [Flavobacterium psychrotrophum]|uniref:DUF4199 domain-containing protein n=1 Tax=Flavobacterium psychrotrophum TaxID=2294119 RepID=UPI000E30E018|nr:DUF4199 domain-containing protein [Flavobacterium psychrotrophum]